MSSSRDIQEQLTRLGSRPTPAPRPEFVEGLLERLLADDVDTDPTVVPFERRGHRLAGKVVWMASAAAALLIAVLAVSVIGREQGGEGFALASAPGETDGIEVTVDDNGYIAQLPAEKADGVLSFTCTEDGRFRSAGGGLYECAKGKAITVRVKDRSIVEVQGATVVDPGHPTVIGLDFQKGSMSPVPSGTWSWEQADPEGFGRYVLLRHEGADPVHGEPGTDVVADIADRKTLSFEISALPLGSWTYQLVVFDTDGEVTALSDLVIVNTSPS